MFRFSCLCTKKPAQLLPMTMQKCGPFMNCEFREYDRSQQIKESGKVKTERWGLEEVELCRLVRLVHFDGNSRKLRKFPSNFNIFTCNPHLKKISKTPCLAKKHSWKCLNSKHCTKKRESELNSAEKRATTILMNIFRLASSSFNMGRFMSKRALTSFTKKQSVEFPRVFFFGWKDPHRVAWGDYRKAWNMRAFEQLFFMLVFF